MLTYRRVLGLIAVVVVAYLAWWLGRNSVQVAVATSSVASIPRLETQQGSERASSLSVTTAGRLEGKPFRDCESKYCPWMVLIPPGSFLMGSADSEKGRDSDEGPVHEVKISRAFAAGEFPITRGEWRAYLEASGRSGSKDCYGWSESKRSWEQKLEYDWQNPGFPQNDNHPVVCVTWDEARAYAAWLSERTHHTYRLLSEAEYEYINRAGTNTAYIWGDTDEGQCSWANGADAAARAHFSNWTGASACNDGHVYTSPVGIFAANRFGLHDTTGNIWSWTQDCYHDSYEGAPVDGTAWLQGGDCSLRVVRGGAWYDLPNNLRAAQRSSNSVKLNNVGLRLARS